MDKWQLLNEEHQDAATKSNMAPVVTSVLSGADPNNLLLKSQFYLSILVTGASCNWERIKPVLRLDLIMESKCVLQYVINSTQTEQC